jgi:hypothetical protein
MVFSCFRVEYHVLNQVLPGIVEPPAVKPEDPGASNYIKIADSLCSKFNKGHRICMGSIVANGFARAA